MLYTPKYIQNNDLDKKICKYAECKKYRVLYSHSNMVEDKEKKEKVVNSDIMAVCSKCKSMYRFKLRHIFNNDVETYEVGKINEINETYKEVRENIEKNYNSYDSIYSLKGQDFLTKVIKEEQEDNSSVTEYVFMEK